MDLKWKHASKRYLCEFRIYIYTYLKKSLGFICGLKNPFRKILGELTQENEEI